MNCTWEQNGEPTFSECLQVVTLEHDGALSAGEAEELTRQFLENTGFRDYLYREVERYRRAVG